MKHLKDVKGMSSKELGRALADLDYAALQDVMRELGACISMDLIKDSIRGRHQLADSLCNVADAIETVVIYLEPVMKVCKPYNES